MFDIGVQLSIHPSTIHVISRIEVCFSGRRGGLVVERRSPEREVGGSILTQVAVLCP